MKLPFAPTLLAFSLLLGGLVGCDSAPPRRIFVLSEPALSASDAVVEVGGSAIEVRPVSVPDYLDSTDILVREGQNELKPLSSGAWGERLSIGLTRAMGAALKQRLPGNRVMLTPMPGQPTRQVLIDVEGFDVYPDGRCALTAQWTVLGKNRQPAGASRRGTFNAPASRSRDPATDAAAIVAAMTRAVDQLADSVAATVKAAPDRS
jgi:uncharacterized lipoprotein YmbA